MEFLRRLHPGEGQRTDAARLDLGALRAGGLRGPWTRATAAGDEPGDAPSIGDAGPRRSGVALRRHEAAEASDARSENGEASGAIAARTAASSTPQGMSMPVRSRATGDPSAAVTPSSAALPGTMEGRAGHAAIRSRSGLPEAPGAPAERDPPTRHDASHAATTAPAAASPAVPHDGTAFELGTLRVSLPQPATGSPLRHIATLRRSDVDASAVSAARAADAAPIVHVTIDRIDVRLPPAAAPPTPVARQPARAARATPLADYLRGRAADGGAR